MSIALRLLIRPYARVQCEIALMVWLAATALGCAPRASAIGSVCSRFLHPELNLPPGGTSDLTLDLDCDRVIDTVFIDRVADGPDRGLPRVVVSLNGRRRWLALMTDGLPKIVDAGDLDGDGVVDLLLANADESISIWPTVILVTPDSLILARESADMGVYHFDPIAHPECDYRSLLPTLERGQGRRLLISWIDTSVTSNATKGDCRHPLKARWEVVAGELRRQQ